MDEFAQKNLCLAAAQCLCALACYVPWHAWMGEEQEGQAWGIGLGTTAEQAARLLRREWVGGDGNLGALGGMAQLALPARPRPWLSLLLCSHPTFSLLLFFASGELNLVLEGEREWCK